MRVYMRQQTAKIASTNAQTKAAQPKPVVRSTTVASRFLNILMNALSAVAV
jgi:hypothetical protein